MRGLAEIIKINEEAAVEALIKSCKDLELCVCHIQNDCPTHPQRAYHNVDFAKIEHKVLAQMTEHKCCGKCKTTDKAWFGLEDWTGICRWCNEVTHLNEDDICKECYDWGGPPN